LAATATLDETVDDVVDNVRSLSRLRGETEWLRSGVAASRPVGVDRDKGIIYGRVLAELGPFKSDGRGEFDSESLDKIVELAGRHPNGLKSRFTHPGLSADGLGKFLGRDKNIRRDGDKVRGDLHFDRTALESSPSGGKPLGQYVMDLAESDPDAFGSSLVLRSDKQVRLEADGTAKKTPDGKELPPLWRPTKLHAIDVVDEGDAVHSGFLSADLDGLPDHVVREVSAALDHQFTGCDRATIEARGTAFLQRYLDSRFEGDDMAETETGGGTKPAPKPPTPPTQPTQPQTPRPPAEPKPAPNQPPAGELSEIDRARAALMADIEAERTLAAQRLAAERERARYADELACMEAATAILAKGTITPAALSDADPGFVPLGTFLHLLDNSQPVVTEKVAGKDRPVTLRAAFLKLLPHLRPQTGGERLQQAGDERLSQRERIKAWSDRQQKRQPAAAK
jgi:hypothetical protein